MCTYGENLLPTIVEVFTTDMYFSTSPFNVHLVFLKSTVGSITWRLVMEVVLKSDIGITIHH